MPSTTKSTAFRYALRGLRFSEEITGAFGTTHQQYQTMLAIKTAENEPITIGALADALMIAPNAIDRSAAPGASSERDGLRKALQARRAALPKGRAAIEEIVAEGDCVAIRWTVRLPGAGIAGGGTDILKFRDGQVIERWGNFDGAGRLHEPGRAAVSGEQNLKCDSPRVASSQWVASSLWIASSPMGSAAWLFRTCHGTSPAAAQFVAVLRKYVTQLKLHPSLGAAGCQLKQGIGRIRRRVRVGVGLGRDAPTGNSNSRSPRRRNSA